MVVKCGLFSLSSKTRIVVCRVCICSSCNPLGKYWFLACAYVLLVGRLSGGLIGKLHSCTIKKQVLTSLEAGSPPSQLLQEQKGEWKRGCSDSLIKANCVCTMTWLQRHNVFGNSSVPPSLPSQASRGSLPTLQPTPTLYATQSWVHSLVLDFDFLEYQDVCWVSLLISLLSQGLAKRMHAWNNDTLHLLSSYWFDNNDEVFPCLISFIYPHNNLYGECCYHPHV